MANFSPTGLITLTSDFGTQDGYVGAMKGVVLTACPTAQLVDITHDIDPQDIAGGAFALAQSAPQFPPGTIHVAVVDPGVGGSRRALLVADESSGALYLGPDNGLLWLALRRAPFAAFSIDRIPPDWAISKTFHGRDVFARVAARIAAGAPISAFCSSDSAVEMQSLGWSEPGEIEGGMTGAVVHVDRFGNLVTNVEGGRILARRRCHVELAGSHIPLVTTYADVERGSLLAYVGSARYLEIAQRDGSAAQFLGTPSGTPLVVRFSTVG